MIFFNRLLEQLLFDINFYRLSMFEAGQSSKLFSSIISALQSDIFTFCKQYLVYIHFLYFHFFFVSANSLFTPCKHESSKIVNIDFEFLL